MTHLLPRIVVLVSYIQLQVLERYCRIVENDNCAELIFLGHLIF